MIEKLKSLTRDELIKKWWKVFNIEPPAHARKEFLIKHIVWDLQSRRQGSYSAQTLKKLNKLAEALAKGKDITEKSTKLLKESASIDIKAGTKLIREYQGKKHEVTALDKGFEYKNTTYKSLSAIANEITGTRWNGRIFFGIKKSA